MPLRRELFRDILKVGAVACLSPMQSVITMLLMAGFVAQLGVLRWPATPSASGWSS